jgi:hypothetical protein
MRRAMRVRLRSSQRSSSAAAKVTRIEILCNVLPDICNVRHCCMCLGGASPPPPGGNFFFFFLGPLQNRGPFSDRFARLTIRAASCHIWITDLRKKERDAERR